MPAGDNGVIRLGSLFVFYEIRMRRAIATPPRASPKSKRNQTPQSSFYRAGEINQIISAIEERLKCGMREDEGVKTS
jgi:hypothetical protein